MQVHAYKRCEAELVARPAKKVVMECMAPAPGEDGRLIRSRKRSERGAGSGNGVGGGSAQISLISDCFDSKIGRQLALNEKGNRANSSTHHSRF